MFTSCWRESLFCCQHKCWSSTYRDIFDHDSGAVVVSCEEAFRVYPVLWRYRLTICGDRGKVNTTAPSRNGSRRRVECALMCLGPSIGVHSVEEVLKCRLIIHWAGRMESVVGDALTAIRATAGIGGLLDVFVAHAADRVPRLEAVM